MWGAGPAEAGLRRDLHGRSVQRHSSGTKASERLGFPLELSGRSIMALRSAEGKGQLSPTPAGTEMAAGKDTNKGPWGRLGLGTGGDTSRL